VFTLAAAGIVVRVCIFFCVARQLSVGWQLACTQCSEKFWEGVGEASRYIQCLSSTWVMSMGLGGGSAPTVQHCGWRSSTFHRSPSTGVAAALADTHWGCSCLPTLRATCKEANAAVGPSAACGESGLFPEYGEQAERLVVNQWHIIRHPIRATHLLDHGHVYVREGGVVRRRCARDL
jgi:hypothetical protein